MISNLINQFKDLIYGKTPAPIDPEVQKKALKGYKRGETPINDKPACHLNPELDGVRKKNRIHILRRGRHIDLRTVSRHG